MVGAGTGHAVGAGMTTMHECQCEHCSHFKDSEGRPVANTPNGNPGHKYGAKFTADYMRTVQTGWGGFRVCRDCAEDCQR